MIAVFCGGSAADAPDRTVFFSGFYRSMPDCNGSPPPATAFFVGFFQRLTATKKSRLALNPHIF
jgi:hypothetical protein